MPECRPEVKQSPHVRGSSLAAEPSTPPPTGLSPRANALFSGTEDSALTWQSESDEKTQSFQLNLSSPHCETTLDHQETIDL